MAWNDPNDGDRDPWGGKRSDQGPPDLDEVVRKVQQKLAGLFGGRRPGIPSAPRQGEPAGPIILAVIGFALLVVLVVSSFWQIDSAERGIVLRFGRYVDTLLPGPHFRLPQPIENVVKVNVDQIRAFPVKASILTKDENIVDVEMSIQYRIKDPVPYLLKISDPDESVQRAAESSIRETIGTSTIDFVINEGRAEIASKVGQAMQIMLDGYESGIQITSVNMQRATAPEEVKSAFDDAIKSREDRQRKINEAEAYRNEIVERSEGEASRIRLESEAYKGQVVARAEGEAKRFTQMLTQYEKAPEVMRERLYLDTVEEVLGEGTKVMVDAQAGNLLYLPIDKLIEQARAGAASAAPQTDSDASGAEYAPAQSADGPGRERNLSRARGVR
ncbi:MAG: FtsH protease activity modulator HflK [Gammaproteobacteria bacterium]|nr:FtsH protease activity modulator HflK [Gammaproteobacteria bacterium]